MWQATDTAAAAFTPALTTDSDSWDPLQPAKHSNIRGQVISGITLMATKD